MISNAIQCDLSGPDWEFKSSEHGAKSASQGPWLKARVPGNIHTDLMALGLLLDPHLAENEAGVGWVEEKDWWYQKHFRVSAELKPCQRVVLQAEGLDTYATLWVNRRLLGKSRN